MTLEQKIKNLTWFKEIIKLKEILLEFFQSISSIQTDVEDLQNNPVDSRPYKVYTALLTQIGTNAPTPIVLENTLGNIIWSREGVGAYTGVLTNAFVENKTAILYALNNDSNFDYSIQMYRESNSTIYIFTGVDLDTSDSILNISTPIEIRVYN